MSTPGELPVIIAGAGIIGLALAQALQKEEIGNVFLDLATAETRFMIPCSYRLRVSRGKLRNLLATGIEMIWGKSISGFKPTEKGILVFFTDGTEVEGSLLAGADGSRSRIRQLLMGHEKGRLNQLHAHYLAVTLRLTQDEADRLRKIEPNKNKFQGSHPDTGFHLWYSILSTAEINGSSGTNSPYCEAQLDISWLVKGPEDSVPTTNAGRIAKIKWMAAAGSGFANILRKTLENIPEDAEVVDISLADWPTVPWNGFYGRVTLLGDAAHPLTMYRGEAANHGLTDARNLMEQLKLWRQGEKTRQKALADYEAEMIERGHEAVLLSRQACLDAHDIRNIRLDSPMLNRKTHAIPPGLRVQS